MLDVLMSIKADDGSLRFSADEITGMFISMMFAGHNTTSGTAAWTLIELLRKPDFLQEVIEKLENLYGDGSPVSYQALREIPKLKTAIKTAGTWAWQRDFFDVGNATHTFIEMIKANALSAGMQARIERASSKNLLPGHYVIGQGPSSLWPKTTN